MSLKNASAFKEGKKTKLAQEVKDDLKNDLMTKMSLNLPVSLHKKFKLRCVQDGKKMSDVLVGLLQDYMNT